MIFTTRLSSEQLTPGRFRDGLLRTQVLRSGLLRTQSSEPLWPSGKALGRHKDDVGSSPTSALILLKLFKSCGLWTQ